MNRNECVALDAADPLRALREQFDLPAGVIYLDGNSLGARPKSALARAQAVIEQEWGSDLIRSWNKAGWFELPARLGDKLAPLIGAGAGEVVVTDSTSINLFKVLAEQSSSPKWNFYKYVVDRQGKVIANFSSLTKPESPEFIAAVEQALASKP